MNNNDNNELANQIITPNVTLSDSPTISTPPEPLPKKKNNKPFIIIFALLGVVVIASILFIFISSNSKPKQTRKANEVIQENNTDKIKEEVLTGFKEKSINVNAAIAGKSSNNGFVEKSSATYYELKIPSVTNYKFSIIGSDTLHYYFIRYYNMDYNYVELDALNKYDKLYLVVINSSNVNDYNFILEVNPKNSYNAENYNNYNYKNYFVAKSGNITKLSNINAIYDEVHQTAYGRMQMNYDKAGLINVSYYQDFTNGLVYIKVPTSKTWTKQKTEPSNINFKLMEEMLMNVDEESKSRLNNTVYKIKNVDLELDEPALKTNKIICDVIITFKDNKISKLVYELGDVDEYKSLQRIVEISNINTSGDVVIPKDVLK